MGKTKSRKIVRTQTEETVYQTPVIQNNYITNNFNYGISKEEPNLVKKSNTSQIKPK